MAMMGTTKSLECFGREASAVKRERSAGHYSALEYLLAKVTSKAHICVRVHCFLSRSPSSPL